ncbi:MAG TPA: TIGR02530 family flagellar biosynthesis protein [Bacteriovoracaceae bacterium]|nr:TIGR02530 family flagellar biosynthesis protein [Bacteriovoracaceae bacterium]
MSNKVNSFLIPNVSTIPKKNEGAEKANALKGGEKSEFKGLIDNLDQKGLRQPNVTGKDVGAEVQVSAHAMKRLQERNIEMDGNEYMKLKEAIGKLRGKGGHDSLVITQKAAYVVDVDKNTVVTAVDRNNMNENVFTKIDSTIFMM